jgi:hypothetical protein
MKEQDAKTKWCPMKKLKLCIASDCMIWRWHHEPPLNDYSSKNTPYSKISGYCGLGGKP